MRGNIIGRYGEIRTLDPCHPMTVRYQAAPHTDFPCNIPIFYKKSITFCLFEHLLNLVNNCIVAKGYFSSHILIDLYIMSRNIGCAVLLGCILSFCISVGSPATLSTKKSIKWLSVAVATFSKLPVN